MNYAEAFAKLSQEERKQFDAIVNRNPGTQSHATLLTFQQMNLLKLRTRYGMPNSYPFVGVRVKRAWRLWYPQHNEPMTKNIQAEMEQANREADADEHQRRWDRFAAAALTGIMAGRHGMPAEKTASIAAEYADAMLAEWNKTKSK